MHHDRFTRGERTGMLIFALIVGAIALLSLIKQPESREEATSPPPSQTIERATEVKTTSDTARHDAGHRKRHSRKKAKSGEKTADKRLYPTQEPVN